jgi:hypothetical protein
MNLEPKKFYKLGSYLFGVVAIMNLLSLIAKWDLLILFDKVSAIASAIFNFLLVFLFIYLYRETPEMPKENVSDEELRRMVGLAPQQEEVKNGN